jgi:hypothetical protein
VTVTVYHEQKRKFYLFQKKSGKRYEFNSHIKLHNQWVEGSSPSETAIASVGGLVVLNPQKCDVRNEEGRKHTGVLSTFPLDFMHH